MLVVPGSVQSNIAANAAFTLPENSLFKSFIDIITRRINSSQGADSYPAEKFASDVVAKALLPEPPLYLMRGGKTRAFTLIKWLPKTWIFWYMFRMWGGR